MAPPKPFIIVFMVFRKRDDNVSSHFNKGVKGGNLNVFIEVPTLKNIIGKVYGTYKKNNANQKKMC